MSTQARQSLVDSPLTKFQSQSQIDDLLDETKTQTGLIAFLTDLIIVKQHPFEFTAIRTDHHDDSELGAHSHADEDAVDGWFLVPETVDGKLTCTAGNYLDQLDYRFLAALKDAALDEYEYQVGLGGSAYTQADIAAAGPTVFQDNGSDHVHFGAKIV